MKQVLRLSVVPVLLGCGLLLQAETPVHKTVAASATFTPTASSTNSPSPTPSSTATLTATANPTGTRTTLPTDSPTATVSQTPTSTITFTPTWTATNTTTATCTSTPGVFRFSVSPKPDDQGQIHFSWGTTVPADEAYLRVFTSGYRMVWETTFTRAEKPEFLTAGDHDVTWNGRDDQGRPMPPGYYICFISVTVGKKTYETNSKTEIP